MATTQLLLLVSFRGTSRASGSSWATELKAGAIGFVALLCVCVGGVVLCKACCSELQSQWLSPTRGREARW